MEDETAYKLALGCAERQITAPDFLNLYKEFYTERLATSGENDESPAADSTAKELCDTLAVDFLRLLNSQKHLIIVDYLVQVLFVNYNTILVHAFLPRLYSVGNSVMLLHFFSQSSAFLANLSDSLIADEVSRDAPGCIIPNVLNANINEISDELVVAIARFLQLILKNMNGNATIASERTREGTYTLMSRLSKLNRLLHRKISVSLDAKIGFKDANIPATKDATHDFMSSPTISSPQFIPSPFSTSKVPTSKAFTPKYGDMKLLRFYKNIWLNNKIMNWEPIDSSFLSNYTMIAPTIFQDKGNPAKTVDTELTDLIETSFTCFAQFVSNKQYHQANSYFNLLERQWIIFIVKHIPLLILEHSSGNPQVVTNALENIDDKVVKAIRTYYSEKDDVKKANEDLFDDYPSASLDIRHDFIKNLIKLGLQPSALINDYLGEDQMIDTKGLSVTDELVVTNLQGVQEVISDIASFISTSLDSLDPELITGQATEQAEGLLQILNNFDNISPTKQRELSTSLIGMLQKALVDFDFNRITKICLLLSFNFSHSLTAILSFVTPTKVCEMLMRFIDISWDGCVETKKKEAADSEFETMNIFSSFAWSLLLLIVISQNYDFSLVDVVLQSSDLDLENSFVVPFISKLPEIPDAFFKDVRKAADPNMRAESLLMVEGWLKGLFINGSISDSLVQNVDAKELAMLCPFIFKQVLLALEAQALNDLSNLIGGFEYFLQPFMQIGLIKIVYWLEQYLYSLKSDTIADDVLGNIFTLLDSIFNPSSLNEDSRSFHNAVLRLNAIRLLKVLRKFRVQSQSNYGIYSSEASGHPKLESLIKNLTAALQISPNYNVDPRITSSDNAFPQKQLNYGNIMILNENPINKIMTNQINSFWNLHSSTYYNLDYLREIINLVTPRNFLIDVFRTLEYKLSTYGVPGARNRMSSAESEHVLDYLFYFMALFDIKSQTHAMHLLSLMESNEEQEEPSVSMRLQIKADPVPKQEVAQDDDFDMLFGENDTSTHGADEEIQIINVEEVPKFNHSAAFHRQSFGLILHELKTNYEAALPAGFITQEAYKRIERYHQKYIDILKKCIF
ncbi:hypothetical protein HG536_0A02440 [Torulaspora globosa]|uniref:Mediator of RNA polymerase II transcription subunit 5 n=1 Tax=Torulaspora globosa TaxID=48254 RepID=A0A7G3ZA91_9SACH|nr:uncharacterized protein HG536_0A02440 [Torulaspora globosa]QLL30427.1 hypothetical protein HG536_0A02440 [Torulaspora globosa]